MFNFISSIPDIHNTAIYPITKQVVADAINRLGITEYFGTNINYKSNGVTFSKSTNSAGEVNILQNRLDVAMDYSFAIGDQKYDVTKAIDNSQQFLSYLSDANLKAIFYEPVDQFIINEYERPITITNTCVMVFNDMVAAIDSIQRLNNAFSNGVMQHDLTYTCFLPPALYIRLYQLYKFSGQEPSGFMAYLTRYSGSRIVKTVNRHDTTDVALSIRHVKANVVSSVDIQSGKPTEVGGSKSPNTYQVVFVLTTQMSLANIIGLEYPLVVRNKLLTKDMIPIPESQQYSPATPNHPYFSIAKYNNLMSKQIQVPQDPVYIPWYDNWYPTSQNLLNKYKPFLIAVFTLDDIENDEGVTIINLEEDFGQVSLVPAVIASLKKQGTTSLFPTENILLSVYRNDVMIEPTTLSLQNGTLLTVNNRNTAGVYRIVLSAVEVIQAPLNTIRVINADITVK